jgi:hypothetical protein
VLFRFWLITSLIVAFVVYCGAFGIRQDPAVEDHSSFADHYLGVALLEEDSGRGR